MDSTGSQSRAAAGDQERIHRLVLDHIDEIVYQVHYGRGEGASPDGVLQFVSNRVKSLLGYEAGEFINDPTLWQRSMHPEDLPMLRESTDRIFATKQAGLRLFRMRHKVTGEYRWLEDRVLPQLDEAGNVIGQFGVARDITERKLAEDALRLKTEQLQTVLEALTTFLHTSDWHLASQVVVKGALKQTASEYGFAGVLVDGPALRILAMAGLNPEHPQHRAFLDYARRTYGQEGHWEFTRFDSLHGRVITTGKAVLMNDAGQDPGVQNMIPGHPPLRHFLGVPMLRGAEVVGIIAVANRPGGYTETELNNLQVLAQTAAVLYDSYHRHQRELSLNAEHKEAKQALHLSEERFRIISEQSTLGIFLADTKGECTYVNPILQRLGQRPATDYLGLEWFKVIHPEDRERVIAHWQMAAQNQARFQVVFRSVNLDGRLFWFSATATPIRDAQGLRGYLGLVEDITERTEAQERLRQYAERLQTLSRRLLQTQEAERQRIARELHDEVGQTLTAVKLNLHTLKCPDAPALAEKTLQETMRMVEGLLQQVRQLSLDLHLPQLDYLGLPAALREYVQQQTRRAGLLLEFRAVPAMPRPEPAIELACFRVAQEAVTNVVRHAQAKHVTVELLQDAEALHLTVRDDGVGFDYAAARGRVGQGASLGLLSMEERTALTGGRFTCQSAPQQGTEIRACFPLMVAPQANEP